MSKNSHYHGPAFTSKAKAHSTDWNAAGKFLAIIGVAVGLGVLIGGLSSMIGQMTTAF